MYNVLVPRFMFRAMIIDMFDQQIRVLFTYMQEEFGSSVHDHDGSSDKFSALFLLLHRPWVGLHATSLIGTELLHLIIKMEGQSKIYLIGIVAVVGLE